MCSGEERDLLLGGDMQDVDALAGLARKLDEPLRAHQRGGGVAPHRMRTGIALDAQVHALAQPVFVLGMKRGAAANGLEHRANAVVVLDQERAGRRAHEHLDAAGAGKPFEHCELVGVLPRRTDIEREVAMHAVMRAGHLVGQSGGVRGVRLGVRHLEHRGNAAEHGSSRSAFEVFLVRQAGLAHVHVAVDHARQHMQAAAVDHLGGGGSDLADRSDPAA